MRDVLFYHRNSMPGYLAPSVSNNMSNHFRSKPRHNGCGGADEPLRERVFGDAVGFDDVLQAQGDQMHERHGIC